MTVRRFLNPTEWTEPTVLFGQLTWLEVVHDPVVNGPRPRPHYTIYWATQWEWARK